MVAFLALLAEATNAISAAVIVSCLLLVTVLIIRYQHGEEGVWGGSSVVRVHHRPVQVAVQKLFVPYTLTQEEEAGGSDSSPPSSGVTRVRLRCGAVGRGVLVRWWWGVQRDALLDLLHAPWWRHHATVCDSSALDACSGGLDLDEGSHSVLLELPKGRRLGLGPAPRTGYPLVVVQLDPSDQEDDLYTVGSVVSLLHVPDAVCPEPARMLYQYLKQRTGQFTLVTTLYTQANGVEPPSTMLNASVNSTSSSGTSAKSPIIAPEQTQSDETKDAHDNGQVKSLLQPPTVANSEVFEGSGLRKVSDGQADHLEPPICSSSRKGLGKKNSKEYDVITSGELPSEKDEELEQNLNPNSSKTARSVVGDSRLLVEEVLLGEEAAKWCSSNTAKDSNERVLGYSTLRDCRVTASDERLLLDENAPHSSDAARASCSESFRLVDSPDDNAGGFVKKHHSSGDEGNSLATSGTNTEDRSANISHLSYGHEESSSSSAARISQADNDSEVTEQLHEEEEEDAPSVPVEEANAEEKPFSSSDCVVCQECRTSLALLPCRHVCVCSSCFNQLMASPQQACPLCRQRVQAFFEV